MAAPAETLVSLFQLLVRAPSDIPEPRVGGRVIEAQILIQRSPEYPPSARQARVQGSVVVRAVIGVDGHVKLAKAVSGPPVLHNPAMAAVRRWVYKPATLNGTAVESERRIELHFTLD
jgi:periplasmic protein TonB